MNNNVNYDNIASDYDQRYHKNPHQSALNALRGILSQENLHKVLEVGCGTSHWLKALNSLEGSNLFGIDPSFNMLKSAGVHRELNLCQGVAEHLPFNDSSMDFIYAVNALHHFKNKIVFFEESFRVLNKGGKLAVIGMDPRDNRNRWYIYKFFEGTYKNDLRRFPSWSEVEGWFSQSGFEDIYFEDVEFIQDPKQGKKVLKDPFLKKSGCSQLALLSDAAYIFGLEKIKNSLKENPSSPILFENDIVLSMIVGKKPVCG